MSAASVFIHPGMEAIRLLEDCRDDVETACERATNNAFESDIEHMGFWLDVAVYLKPSRGARA